MESPDVGRQLEEIVGIPGHLLEKMQAGTQARMLTITGKGNRMGNVE